MAKKHKKKICMRIYYGFDGRSISIAGEDKLGMRVAGEKPWNGGYLLEEWELNSKDLISRIQSQKTEGKVFIRTGKVENTWTFSIGDEELEGQPRDIFECAANKLIKTITTFQYS